MGAVTGDGDGNVNVKTTITKEQYYAGLGLYMLILKKSREIKNLRDELNELLVSPTVDNYKDWIMDWIWGYDNTGTPKEFNELLEKIELEMEE